MTRISVQCGDTIKALTCIALFSKPKDMTKSDFSGYVIMKGDTAFVLEKHSNNFYPYDCLWMKLVTKYGVFWGCMYLTMWETL